MNNWHSKSLGDGMWASMPAAQIEAIFLPIFASAGKPAEMAVFTRHETEGRLHCEVIAYFSPATEKVAKGVGALPCKKPSSKGLSLLAGDQDCWSALFPEIGE